MKEKAHGETEKGYEQAECRNILYANSPQAEGDRTRGRIKCEHGFHVSLHVAGHNHSEKISCRTFFSGGEASSKRKIILLLTDFFGVLPHLKNI